MVTNKTKRPLADADPTNDISSQLSACAYLLIMLLQRMEGAQQGMIDDLRRSIDRDLSAIQEGEPDHLLAEKTLQESLRILAIATTQVATAAAE